MGEPERSDGLGTVAAPAMVPDRSPQTGELLDGRYILEARIGAGGMGVVYRARDELLGRTVAVKIFRESAADPSRTASETRLLAALNHSSLVTLFDARTEEGQPNYLVMEYVDGPTLSQRISEAPLTSSEVAVLALDLAEALHVVHNAGIVHRDIKPSNVLLRRSHVPGETHRAKLADFGIAYLIDSTRLTTPGTLIGTVAYLSPEQVRGAEPAAASDIYALGLVLLEALTGERAFPQTGAHEAALARLTRDPVVPGSFGYAWRALLTAMTARDPDHRPSALEVVVAASRLNDSTSDDTTAISGALPTAVTIALGESVTSTVPAHLTHQFDSAPAQRMAPLEEHTVSGIDTTARSEPRDRQNARRRQLIIAVAALAVVAILIGLLVWALGASSSPSGVPSLPSLGDPLDAHMRALLEAVTP